MLKSKIREKSRFYIRGGWHALNPRRASRTPILHRSDRIAFAAAGPNRHIAELRCDYLCQAVHAESLAGEMPRENHPDALCLGFQARVQLRLARDEAIAAGAASRFQQFSAAATSDRDRTDG